MWERLRVIVSVSRPLGYLGIPSIFLVGVLSGGGFAAIDAVILLQMVLLTLPVGIVIYGLNDIYDYQSDLRNALKSNGTGEVLSPRYHSLVSWAAFISAAMLVGFLLLVQNYQGAAIMLVMLSVAYAYSVPPLRLKTRPPLDSIVNGFGYVFLPISLGYSYTSGIAHISNNVFFLSLFAVGLHAYLTIRDFEPDRLAGDKTFAVVFGRRATALFASVCFAGVAAYYVIDFQNSHPLVVLLFVGSFLLSVGSMLYPKNGSYVALVFKIIFVLFLLAVAGILYPFLI